MYRLKKGTKIKGEQLVYRIEEVLGQGGFGITYKVTTTINIGNIEQNITLALKELFIKGDCERDNATQNVTYSKSAAERIEASKKDFIAEANRLANIKHPNIVKINEVIEANNTVYYVMQYINNGSLKNYVDSHGAISESEMLTYMRPIIDAVGTLHSHNTNHLDIKPANVMLCKSSNGTINPVLIDFGLSKHFDNDGNATSSMRTHGYSDGYSPIEQYAGINTFSPQADIYALGATMLYCLTGKRPPRAIDIDNDTISNLIPSSVSDCCRKAIINAMISLRKKRTTSTNRLLNDLDCRTNVEPINSIDDSSTLTIGRDQINNTPTYRQFTIKCIDEFGQEVEGCDIRLRNQVDGVIIKNNTCFYRPIVSQSISLIINKRGYEDTITNIFIRNFANNHIEFVRIRKRFTIEQMPKLEQKRANSKHNNKSNNKYFKYLSIAFVFIAICIGIFFYISTTNTTKETPTTDVIDTTNGPSAEFNNDLEIFKINSDNINKKDLQSQEFKDLIDYIATGNTTQIIAQMERCYGQINDNGDINGNLREIYSNLTKLINAGEQTKVGKFASLCQDSCHYNDPKHGTDVNLSKLNEGLKNIINPPATPHKSINTKPAKPRVTPAPKPSYEQKKPKAQSVPRAKPAQKTQNNYEVSKFTPKRQAPTTQRPAPKHKSKNSSYNGGSIFK